MRELLLSEACGISIAGLNNLSMILYKFDLKLLKKSTVAKSDEMRDNIEVKLFCPGLSQIRVEERGIL